MHRIQRCGDCIGCTAVACGNCVFCKDSPNFGGPGLKKQSCIRRKCVVVLESNLKKDAATSHRLKIGCGQCDECLKEDCGVCLICFDKTLFDSKYFPAEAACYKKKCTNGKSLKTDPYQTSISSPPGPVRAAVTESESEYDLSTTTNDIIKNDNDNDDNETFIKPPMKRLKVLNPIKKIGLLKPTKRKVGRPSRNEINTSFPIGAGGKIVKKRKHKKLSSDTTKEIRKGETPIFKKPVVLSEDDETDDVVVNIKSPTRKLELKRSCCPKIVELILDPNRPLNPMERAFISIMKPRTDNYSNNNNNSSSTEDSKPYSVVSTEPPRSSSVVSTNENQKAGISSVASGDSPIYVQPEIKKPDIHTLFRSLPRATLVPKKEDGTYFEWPPTKVIYPISVDTVPADNSAQSTSSDASNPLGFIVAFDSDQFTAHLGTVTGFSPSPIAPVASQSPTASRVLEKESFQQQKLTSFNRPVFDAGHNYHQIPNF